MPFYYPIAASKASGADILVQVNFRTDSGQASYDVFKECKIEWFQN